MLFSCAVGVALAGCGPVTGEPISFRPDPRAALAQGLVGYWKLDEMTADEPVLDSSGRQHHGAAVNGPVPSPMVAPTKFGNVASRTFAGVGQHIDLGNPAGLGFSGPMTLAAWVQITSARGCDTIISHGFRLNPPAEVALRTAQGSCGTASLPSTWAAGAFDGANHFAESVVLPQDIGQWIHLVGTFDGGAWRLYRNGAQVAMRTTTAGPRPFDASWALGGHAPGSSPSGNRELNGNLDEVRVYERALTPADVLDLYNL